MMELEEKSAKSLGFIVWEPWTKFGAIYQVDAEVFHMINEDYDLLVAQEEHSEDHPSH